MLPHKFKFTQSGTAILMALCVVTLVTAMSILWFKQSRVLVHRTEQMLKSEQAYLSAQKIVYWAKGIIKKTTDQDYQKFPIYYSSILPGEGEISGYIDDYQGRLNINTKAAFIRLIVSLDKAISEGEAGLIADAIVAWITPFNLITGRMTEINAIYLQNTPSYHAANQFMQNVSELRAVAGITPTLYSQLKPHVSALPPNTEMNFANSSLPILNAYHIDPKNPVKSKSSEYFLVRSEVKLIDQYLILYTLLHKQMINNQMNVGVIWQSVGD
jgi:general secretion pathway protein K